MRQHYWVPGAILLLLSGQAMAIGLGNLDDFEDDTVQGWIQPANPFGTLNIPGGGDGGAEDNYLEVDSFGEPGPGGKQVAVNLDPRWTGDWVAAGVNKVRVNIANFGFAPVSIRIAFQRVGIDCWASTTAAEVPADAIWRNYEFVIAESTMTQVSGAGTFTDALSNVSEIRVLSAVAAASCQGDQVQAFVGYDDFQSDSDTDLDGINDSGDNCIEAANPRVCIDDNGAVPVPAPAFANQADCETAGNSWGQPDTDGDLYGNACDFDIAPQPGPFLSGDCAQNFLDIQAVKAAFFSSSTQPTYNPNADFDFNGSINFTDLQAITGGLFGTPGPGLGNCGCAPVDQGLDNGADFYVDNDMDMINDIDQVFVRGGMVLDWGAVDQINNVVNNGGGTYQAKFNINAPGSFGYKVADFDWAIEYVNNTVPTDVGVPVTLDLFGGFANGTLNVPEAGCYQFDFTVVPAVPPDPLAPVPQLDLTVTGPLP